MRGARVRELRVRPADGIIPAYAGSTRRCTRPRDARRDHPRVCGEHAETDPPEVPEGGSSPRMRGARLDLIDLGLGSGIIPAYAGSTSRAPCWPSSCRDHPRVCGEHRRASARPSPLRGSSPRMRGAPGQPSSSPADAGIIPAYAGSTWSRHDVMLIGGDHPRVCGEHRRLPVQARQP